MMLLSSAVVFATVVMPPAEPPVPPPIVRPVGLAADEKPVSVSKTEKVAESDGLFRFVTAAFVFENPNGRPLAADFEFPIPSGASVCGYSLEIDGEMIPGVVCEKEKARVAFENEVRKRVDPGIVEHVKGNVWRTRIFPLPAQGTRRAEVAYIAEMPDPSSEIAIERCGGYVYEGRPVSAPANDEKGGDSVFGDFTEGVILWDASFSRKDKTGDDLAKLAKLPEKGNWTLVVFRNVPSKPVVFASRDELVSAVSAEPCDGGTDLAAAIASIPESSAKTLLFSDEMDTLGDASPDLESRGDIVFASRPPAPRRRTSVVRRKATDADKAVRESKLLATAWAARRMEDLSFQADSRREEFLALGREFGVASEVSSLIVLETLDQYLEHKIEPPRALSFHDEWARRRAAEDDPIRAKKEQADFEAKLLKYWAERVEWWKNPKPKVETPKSGLFSSLSLSRVARSASAEPAESVAIVDGSGVNESVAAEEAAEDMDVASAPAPAAMAQAAAPSGFGDADAGKRGVPGSARSVAASVTLAAWDPKTPYIDALSAAAPGTAYGAYLAEREKYGSSPAFYLDCAGWFFKAGETLIAKRIISNLAEFRLENVALWRTMGWRLREAGAYDESIAAFRHVLRMRGEEGQSYRDLALVLSERGKDSLSAADLEEAMELFFKAAFENHARRAARRSNDIQVAVVALEELNGLIAWCAAREWPGGARPETPKMDEAFRRDLPMDLRIILSWDADETDIDLHVLEPNGEEAFYQHRRTREGGFVGEDVTTGYGPEEYLAKDAQKGVYKVLSNYFASHQQALLGAATVTATVYTNWSRAGESRRTMTLRLDKPKDKHMIGEIEIK